jgi:hypothetical protein
MISSDDIMLGFGHNLHIPSVAKVPNSKEEKCVHPESCHIPSVAKVSKTVKRINVCILKVSKPNKNVE